ncbi:MAG: NAD-dependent protein deacylase [Eubacteriales bacterium]|nr:NAD-dependent protein deacylase [Eubacteriales bacterium]
MNNINQFLQWVEESDNIVFFGGAGVSTESGIPDFRSADGLYNQKYDYPPETIISHTFYMQKPDIFFKFYKEKMIYPEAEPSTTHKVLAALEKAGKLKGVITQNIDGLHQKAGSRNVIELHGSVLRNYCEKCHKFYDVNAIMEKQGIPCCDCGGRIKPDVVLYEEGLDDTNIRSAISLIKNADLFIVGGTSLGVYPAAGLIDYYRGDKLVLINKSPTPYDSKADLLISDALGKVFSEIKI